MKRAAKRGRVESDHTMRASCMASIPRAFISGNAPCFVCPCWRPVHLQACCLCPSMPCLRFDSLHGFIHTNAGLAWAPLAHQMQTGCERLSGTTQGRAECTGTGLLSRCAPGSGEKVTQFTRLQWACSAHAAQPPFVGKDGLQASQHGLHAVWQLFALSLQSGSPLHADPPAAVG